MIWLYVAAAIFGGGFVIPALFGALDLDADADFDLADADFDVDGLELDADLDGDFDGDADSDAENAVQQVAGSAGDWIASLLTFRTMTFFATFFGLVGMVLTWLGYTEPLPLISAVALGLFAGVVNARLMSYLKRTETSAQLTETHLRGAVARVVLPITGGRRGRVEIDVAGQPTFMVALPYKDGSADLDRGRRVVVVEVREGTAYVTAAPELEGGI